MTKDLFNRLLKHPKYYKLIKQLDRYDWSHNRFHLLRVRKTALKIAKEEGGDGEIVEAACLLFDIARLLEQRKLIKDHAVEGAKIAKKILNKIDFNKEKIDNVCHAIRVHRKSQLLKTETIEAKILQDADYLDALGAIDVARVLASCFQSKMYKKPVFIDEFKTKISTNNLNKSAIHYILYKISMDKMKPENFHTKTGKKMAKHRYEYIKNYCKEFILEWRGDL